MLGTLVKDYAHAAPFMPFVIEMTDGRRFPIRHPDFISVSPRGGSLVVYGPEDNGIDGGTHLSGLLVASVRPLIERQSSGAHPGSQLGR